MRISKMIPFQHFFSDTQGIAYEIDTTIQNDTVVWADHALKPPNPRAAPPFSSLSETHALHSWATWIKTVSDNVRASTSLYRMMMTIIGV